MYPSHPLSLFFPSQRAYASEMHHPRTSCTYTLAYGIVYRVVATLAYVNKQGQPASQPASQPESWSGRLLRGSVMTMTTTTLSLELQVYQAASRNCQLTYILPKTLFLFFSVVAAQRHEKFFRLSRHSLPLRNSSMYARTHMAQSDLCLLLFVSLADLRRRSMRALAPASSERASSQPLSFPLSAQDGLSIDDTLASATSSSWS
ncbi:hypothetical protein IWZ03DRAFT_369120 [Phyllosticta citriasiana]|uniref:Uncharacterized protein n=1 Tax=Phyllosticta citriasiana TaxID=595635 RepID=A0ABR1KTY5_9PEZI